MSLNRIARAFGMGRSSTKYRSSRKQLMPDCDKTADGTKIHIWDSSFTGKKLNVIESEISPLTDNFTRDCAVSEVRYEEYSAYGLEDDGDGDLKVGCYYEYNSIDGSDASNGKADNINKIEARKRSIRKYVHG